MPDLNAATIESAMSMVEGTCRSMGAVSYTHLDVYKRQGKEDPVFQCRSFPDMGNLFTGVCVVSG